MLLMSRYSGVRERGGKELFFRQHLLIKYLERRSRWRQEHQECRITADTRHRQHRAYKQGNNLDNEGHTSGTNELMMRTEWEQETDQKWAREEWKHKIQEDRIDIYSPLPEGLSRALQHPMGRGGGLSGGLQGPGDMTDGLQGGARSGTQGGSGDLGGHGGSGNSGGHGRAGSLGGHGGSTSETVAQAPASASTARVLLLPPPKKNLKILRRNRGFTWAFWRGGRSGNAGTWGRSGNAGTWGCSGMAWGFRVVDTGGRSGGEGTA